MSNRQTIEQKRAASAWTCIQIIDGRENIQKEYGSWARGLPALIQTNGLGQALAFLKAKGGGNEDKHQTLLYKHLSDWVSLQLTDQKQDLLQWVITQNSGAYRRATREALAYALWLRRFAEAQGWGSEGGMGDG